MPGRDRSQEDGRGEGRKKRRRRKAGRRCWRRAEDSVGEERGRLGCLQGEREGMQEAEWREGVRGLLERGCREGQRCSGRGPKDAGGGRAGPGWPKPAARCPPEPQLQFGPRSLRTSEAALPLQGGPRTHFLTRPRPLLKGPARLASPLKPQPARISLQSQAHVWAPNRLSAPARSQLGDSGGRSASAEGSYRCLSLGPRPESPHPTPAPSPPEANYPPLSSPAGPPPPPPSWAQPHPQSLGSPSLPGRLDNPYQPPHPSTSPSSLSFVAFPSFPPLSLPSSLFQA